MKVYYYCILFVIGIVAISTDYNGTLAEGLYDGDPDILVLNDANFNVNVFAQNRIVMVIFYASWCGACQRFSEIAKKAARQMHDWQRVFIIATIDCPTNHKTCLQHNIRRYPEIYLLRQHCNDINDCGVNIQERIAPDLYHIVLNFVATNHYRIMSKSVRSKDDICQTFMEENSTIAPYAIVEHNPPTEISAQLVLSMQVFFNDIQTRRFHGGSDLVDSLHSMNIDLPAILQMQLKPCSFRVMFNSGQNISKLKQEFLQYANELFQPDNQFPVTLPPPINDALKVVKYKLTWHDLYNTLRQSLMNEILSVSTFNQTQIDVMRQYFVTIFKYFPFRNENLRRYFKRMANWLVIYSKPTLQAIQLKEVMRTGGDGGYLMPMEGWRHCNGSKPYLRGYPCGLWVLFHTLTVNEYLLGAKNGTVKHEVLPAMRNYVITFFGCKECAEHFDNATSRMATEIDVNRAESSVMYLWRTHNNVNRRLRGGVTEDPFYPKEQFPAHTICRDCFLDTDEYNDTAVLSFLISNYRKKSIQSSAMSISNSINTFLIVSTISTALSVEIF